MKKQIKIMLLMLLCACLLSSCTKSTIIDPVDYSDLPQPGPDGLVWDQIWEEWVELYEDESTYSFAGTINAYFDSDEGVVKFFLLTDSDIPEKKAAQYAMDVVKGLGYLISQQSSAYAEPSDTSFGGYLALYDIYVMVGNDDTKADESTWTLEDRIPAGEYREFSNGN